MVAALTALLGLLGLGAPVARAHALSESEYYTMPELFTLEEWDPCLAPPGSLYCLGSFELLPPAPQQHRAVNSTALQLYRRLQEYSENTLLHFNHTRLHRGVCVSSSCPAWRAEAPAHNERAARVFAACVDAHVQATLGLRARLLQLEYCARHGQRARLQPPDALDTLVLALLGALLALAALGTGYHYLVRHYRAPEVECVLAWSVARNWRRLVADSNCEPRLQRLRAIHGMKAISMLLVHFAHAAMMSVAGYVHNPRRVEQAAEDPYMVLLFNGTVIIQTFFLISSFLLTYKTLTYLATQPDIRGVPVFLKGVADRVARVSPSVLVVGAWSGSVAAWPGDGPLWPLLVGAERAHCRAGYWLLPLYLQNVLRLDAKCLPQTWSLAADMHLHCLLLALLLGTRAAPPARRARLLAALYAGAALAQFLLAYCLRLKPALLQQEPEQVHSLHAHNVSFSVLYQSTAANACGALTGALLALLQHELELRAVRLSAHRPFVWAFRAALPALLAWLLMGYALLLRLDGRLPTALYAALDKPVFALLVAVLLLGCIHQVDELYRGTLEWAAWRVLSRLSLAALLVHTAVLRAAAGVRHQPTHVNTFSTVMEWAATSALTYVVSVPLVLVVEYPALSLYQLLVRWLPAPAPPAAREPSPAPPAAPGKAGLRALIQQWDALQPPRDLALRKRQ